MFKVINFMHSIKDFDPIQIDNRPKYSFLFSSCVYILQNECVHIFESFKHKLIGGSVGKWVGGQWVGGRWVSGWWI